MSAPSLIGLDWGTSSLRAFLMRAGQVVETRRSPDGVQRLAGRAEEFERVFAAIAGDWLAQWPALPVVACGMVGSAQGWREAPYLRCPADARALATQGVAVASGAGPEVLIAPGVLFEPAQPGAPDVMRGEETQVVGALLQQPAWSAGATFLLPGTHSKRVRVEDGRIVAVATAMTGELFALLRAHSILGRLKAPGDAHDASAFARGLDDARAASGLLHQLFAVRTLGLTGRLPHAALADYLSGLLIGHELLHAERAATPLVLVGEPALCGRYAQALRHIGAPAEAVLDNTAPAGLWALARAAGVVRA